MINIKYILFFFIFFFISCEKEVRPPYSNKTIQIVVQGEISSELGVEVMVGRALPAFVSLPLDSLVINDALVTLIEDGVIVDTLVNIDSVGQYRLSKPVDITTGHTYSLAVEADGLPSVYSQGVKVYDSCLLNWGAGYTYISNEEGLLEASFSCNPQLNMNLYLRTSALGIGDITLPFRHFGAPVEDGECELIYGGTSYLSSSCYDMNDGKVAYSFEKKVFSYLHDGEYDVKKIRLEFISTVDDGEYYGGVSVGNIGFEEPRLTNSNIIGGFGFFYPKSSKVIVLEL